MFPRSVRRVTPRVISPAKNIKKTSSRFTTARRSVRPRQKFQLDSSLSTAQSSLHNHTKMKRIESLLVQLSCTMLLRVVFLAVSLTSAGQGFRCQPPHSVRILYCHDCNLRIIFQARSSFVGSSVPQPARILGQTRKINGTLSRFFAPFFAFIVELLHQGDVRMY